LEGRCNLNKQTHAVRPNPSLRRLQPPCDIRSSVSTCRPCPTHRLEKKPPQLPHISPRCSVLLVFFKQTGEPHSLILVPASCVMSSNKRRRSSDCGSNSASKFAAVSVEQPPTFISLPEPRIPSTTLTYQMKRRSPLTPPSVTPPSVTVSESTTMRRDRCKSPSSRASALLQKVAVVSSTPSTVPSSPRLCAANSPGSPGSTGLSSNDSTPTSTPPEDGGQFPFGTRQLPESPEG
jgi:hypothetical protein